MNTYSGLDVHKGSIYACIIDEKRKKILEKRYGTLTPDLQELKDTLLKYGVKGVAMESTSIYWMPVWRILQPHFRMKLANPYFIKQMPGRKSDVKDAHWIAECLQKELIKDSYVPDETIQQMRQYSRRYRYLTKSKVRVEQRLDNHLQRCNIRFSNYVSNQGNNVSIRKVVKELIAGERSPNNLVKKVHGRIINKQGKKTVADALSGIITNTDVEMLKMCMEEIELLENQQAACLTSLEELATKHYAREISLLCSIPGIQKTSALCILAETGGDMSFFDDASHLIGWAGLRPRNDETAEKIRSRNILHGNKYLRQILVEVSWVAARSNKSFLGKKYSQLSKRMKTQKALLAITRKMLVIIYNVLKTKQQFDPTRNLQAVKPV
jgi:transposase